MATRPHAPSFASQIAPRLRNSPDLRRLHLVTLGHVIFIPVLPQRKLASFTRLSLQGTVIPFDANADQDAKTSIFNEFLKQHSQIEYLQLQSTTVVPIYPSTAYLDRSVNWNIFRQSFPNIWLIYPVSQYPRRIGTQNLSTCSLSRSIAIRWKYREQGTQAGEAALSRLSWREKPCRR